MAHIHKVAEIVPGDGPKLNEQNTEVVLMGTNLHNSSEYILLSTFVKNSTWLRNKKQRKI